MINRHIYEYILSGNELNVQYQPIISISRKKIIGAEALARASYNGEFISSDLLFHHSKSPDCGKELDLICREMALRGFKGWSDRSFLFINIDASLVKHYLQESESMLQLISSCGIDFRHVVLEINEKGIKYAKDFERFVKFFRGRGFLIALDDIGEGYSNFSRILVSKPDIVKLNKKTISEINKNYYKQVITRSIVDMANRIGALTIAEEVETSAQVVSCLSLGIDLFQGYYFSEAVSCDAIEKLSLDEKFSEIAALYKKSITYDIYNRRKIRNEYKTTLEMLVRNIKNTNRESYEDVIKEFLSLDGKIECIYITDKNGYQITETAFNNNIPFTSNFLLTPLQKNDYHDLKTYYYYALLLEPEMFCSDTYISTATGRLCETTSIAFRDAKHNTCIACIDYAVGNIE